MKFIFLICAIPLSAFFSMTAQAQAIEPGIWKAKSSFALEGISLPSSEDETCVTNEEAKDVKTSISKELTRNGCALTRWKVKNRNLEASVTCKNKDLDAKGTLKGHFSTKDYEFKGVAQGTYKEMLPTSVTLSLSGKWAKPCPK